MYVVVDGFALFLVAILLITIGEMIVMPVSQALAARFAPEDMRGRYMAFFSLSWAIPATVGPLAAGLIMDNFQPQWVWYACGILSALAIAGFLRLHSRTQKRFKVAEAEQVT
ncbi:MAG: MFS transporter [Phycisphaerae bacterium]|nr:MFS transporter [Phycisphaerae bacterium]